MNFFRISQIYEQEDNAAGTIVNDKGTTVIQSDMDRKKPKECQKITTI